MKLILTRHGETIENKKEILMGHQHGKLSDLGVNQAKKVSDRLKDEKIDVIYSSDLNRSADTAKEIAKNHPKIPIRFVEELRERYLGEFQGKTKIEVGWTKTNLSSLSRSQPQDGETLKEMYDRAKNFIDKILHKHKDENVLFVCHQGIGKMIVAVIMGKEAKDIGSIERIDNTSISIFDIYEDKNHKIHLYNDTKHLK